MGETRLDDATVRVLVDVYEYARSSGDNGIYEPGSQGRRRVHAGQVRALAHEVLARRVETCGTCRWFVDGYRCETLSGNCRTCEGPMVRHDWYCADWQAKEEGR